MLFIYLWLFLYSGIVQWETPMEHDFGVIRKQVPVKHAFVFKNVSEEPVILQTVRTTCGCTAADWPEAPIEPDSTGTVLIEFDGYQSGYFRKKIKVFFDKQKRSEILWISGEVE